MTGKLNFTFLDHDGESSSTGMSTGAVTALSLPGLLTQVGTIRAALNGITTGTISGESLAVFQTRLGNIPPANPNAQRESKWLVVYEDSTPFFDPPVNAIPNAGYRKIFTFEIPTADLSLLLPNSDRADLANAAMATFVTEFEATARSPYGGSPTVVEIRHVGRRL